jgi:hypothetical protein
MAMNLFKKGLRTSTKPLVGGDGGESNRMSSVAGGTDETQAKVSIPMTDTNTGGDTITSPTGETGEGVPSNILRRSVLMMEKDMKQRRKAIALFVGLTAALTFLTPLYVIRGLGLIPTFPDVGSLKTSIAAYYTYCRRINSDLATQIYGNYTAAVNEQTADCKSKTDAGYSEVKRVPANSSVYANRYCDHVLERLYATPIITAAPKFASVGGCDAITNGSASQNANAGYVTAWAVNTNVYKPSVYNVGGPYLNGLPVNASDNLAYFFGVFAISPVPYQAICPTQVWDLMWLAPLSRNAYSCQKFQSFMVSNVSAYNTSSASYIQSARDYINYDVSKAAALGSFASSLYTTATTTLQNAYASLTSTATQYDNQLKSGASQAQTAYTNWKSAYDSAISISSVANAIGATNIQVPSPPSISIPEIPASIQKLKTYQTQLLSYQRILSDYNPPAVNWPSSDVSYNYSVPNTTLVVPSITLTDSILVKEIYAAFDALQGVLEYFLAYDIALRVCLWLQDIAFLFMEPRRNFIKTTTRVKNVSAFFFQHLAGFLYLGVFLAIVIVAATFAYDPNTVVEELQTVCHNQVLVQNDETLTGYKNALEGRKVTCNNTLLQINAQIQANDRSFIGSLKNFSRDYEIFYNASVTASSANYPQGATGRSIQNTFYLPGPSLPAYGQQPSYQYYFAFMDYKIDQNLCSGTAEAQAVSTAINYNVKVLGQYVVSLLMIGLGTVICLKFLIWGLQRWYWMELTKGYIMEMDITSAMVKQRVRNYKIQAIAMFVISVSLFIIDLAVYSSAIKNIKV